jgi:hypothetical protein
MMMMMMMMMVGDLAFPHGEVMMNEWMDSNR